MATGGNPILMKGIFWVAGLLLAPCLAVGQDERVPTLSLDEALRMARERNGDVRAAYLNYEQARARARIAYSEFLPTVTPSYRRDASRTEYRTGSYGGFTSDSDSAVLDVDWRVLDSGSRTLRFSSARISREAEALRALQTLRNTLYTVHQRYYDALRYQELLRTQRAQLARAEEIMRQAEAFAQEGAGAEIDIKQANADRLNAVTAVLQGENQVTTGEADLRAIMGWSRDEPMPDLVRPEQMAPSPLTASLEEMVQQGLDQRADLQAQQLSIDAQKNEVRIAKLNASVTYSLDANFRRNFTDDVFDRAGLQLVASLPVYDGNRTRDLVRVEEFALGAQEAQLVQSEREVRAEIESVYQESSLNASRLAAAKGALDAAQENYAAAFERRRLGAGTLVEVITAQVTLVTAEVNYVQAFYDALISEVRLKLATGTPVPGEPGGGAE